MKQADIESISNDVMDIFRGMMLGTISYHQDKLHSAMGTCVGEVLDSVAGDFCMKVMYGKEVTKDDLQTLHDNLVPFQEEYEVKEMKPLLDKINNVLKG